MVANVMQRVRGNWGLLFLALFFGLISAALAYVYLSQAEEDGGGASVSTVPVVVAAQDIAAGAKITPEMITIKALPEEALLPDVFRRTEDVVGKFATTSLVAGEQVLSSKVAESAGPDLASFGDNPPLSLVVPSGMRAVSISVREVSAVGGLIRPGDYVDVIAGVEDENGEIIGGCYLVQDVQVLAIAQAVTVPTAEAIEGETGTVKEANPGAGTATVALTPEQALVVAAAAGNAEAGGGQTDKSLWLALRRRGDHGTVEGSTTPFLEGVQGLAAVCQVVVPALVQPSGAVPGSPAPGGTGP